MPGLQIKALGGVRARVGTQGAGAAGGQAPTGLMPQPAQGSASAAANASGGTVATGTGTGAGSFSIFRPPLTPRKIHSWLVIGAVGTLGFLWWSLPN